MERCRTRPSNRIRVTGEDKTRARIAFRTRSREIDDHGIVSDFVVDPPAPLAVVRRAVGQREAVPIPRLDRETFAHARECALREADRNEAHGRSSVEFYDASRTFDFVSVRHRLDITKTIYATGPRIPEFARACCNPGRIGSRCFIISVAREDATTRIDLSEMPAINAARRTPRLEGAKNSDGFI